MKQFAEFGIEIIGGGPQAYTTCPQCRETRKKKAAKCLSVNLDRGIWNCHHCGWSGSLAFGDDKNSRPFRWKPQVYRKPEFLPSEPTEVLLAWFRSRGISEEVVRRFQIRLQSVYFPQIEDSVEAMVFPYFDEHGVVVNCKYRSLEGKLFRQEFDAKKIVYGLRECTGSDAVIIVEGEVDALSCWQAAVGIPCVSVPDGAPPEGSKPTAQKFDYLQLCESFFAGMKKIVLAVDNDGPGKTLEAELMRRLGSERCWRVTWPDGCKDANEVLVQHGAEILQACLDTAKPAPIEQVIALGDLIADLQVLREQRVVRGSSTGWPQLDELYTIQPGELSIVTGIPGHGKSEFIDALLLQMIELHDWSVAFCSPENLPVTRHCIKLLEKQTGAPFYDTATKARMTEWEMVVALERLHERVALIAPEESMTIPELLSKARGLVYQRGIRALVIDPWNEFDHRRERGLSETEHVSSSLGLIRRFARLHGVHVWIVAHPAKLQKTLDDKYPVPRPYDISGSAHWYNRADNCVSIWRDVGNPERRHITEVHIQKVRNKYVGTVGMVELVWDSTCGRFSPVTHSVSGGVAAQEGASASVHGTAGIHRRQVLSARQFPDA